MAKRHGVSEKQDAGHTGRFLVADFRPTKPATVGANRELHHGTDAVRSKLPPEIRIPLVEHVLGSNSNEGPKPELEGACGHDERDGGEKNPFCKQASVHGRDGDPESGVIVP